MADETKKYRIQYPYYRQGAYYEPGSVVEIPADERPSKTWVDAETGKPVVLPEPASLSALSDDEKALIEQLRAKKAAQAAAQPVPPPAPPKAPAQDTKKPLRAAEKEPI